MRAVCFLLVTAAIAVYPAGAATDPALARLEQQIEHVSHATDGLTGVEAVHIETGRTVSLHASEAFPMASTFKIPVAVQILSLVDDGKLALDKMVPLEPPDLHPYSRLTDLF